MLRIKPKENELCGVCKTDHILVWGAINRCAQCSSDEFMRTQNITIKRHPHVVHTLELLEMEAIESAISYLPSKSEAARQLGITRATLHAKIKKYNLEVSPLLKTDPQPYSETG